MKADNITLQGILNSPNCYIVPVFQRYYSWHEHEWQYLWENLLELQEGEDDFALTHFMGTLVFVPERQQGDVPSFLIVDGQQRLMTLSLLLCALRNIARSHDFPELAAEITDTYLVHPYRQGDNHFRLYPRQRDRHEYLAIVKHTGYRGNRTGITEALAFFFGVIKGLFPAEAFTEEALRRFFRLVVTRLEFVHITLNQENPYRIFKSLNSTGVNLSEADLIRNFVLMAAGTDTAVQDRFDDNYWQPLETLFEDEDERGHLNSYDFSTFFRDFLMREGEYVPRAATFYTFEQKYATVDFDAPRLTLELQKYARFYNMMRGRLTHPVPEVEEALAALRRETSTTTYPLLLNLFGRFAEGKITAVELGRVIRLLTDFIRQRALAEESTRSYSRWFVAACRRLDDSPYQNLHAYLVSKGYTDE